jgi:hypothetical protein
MASSIRCTNPASWSLIRVAVSRIRRSSMPEASSGPSTWSW